ncbi:transcriptional regulator, HxlR family [Chitinophaga sp. YR627]|uniref:winged helix-turn-helix transcriptional regulator n=1 Tax=Chitinophaga sp. YR627 TaxID=1881041 RepID=UPI0008E2E2D1|nr:helix-turn-helix domain-containing protein [Chitinophaga sp. YR627]SFM88279.1 transcriptional regulator, HxlR family [Chitinophaga sp. YR627]
MEKNPVLYKIGKKVFECPVGLATNVINGKWKLQILNLLSQAACMRYGDLKRGIDEVSEKMLIQHLRELEGDGLIFRRVYGEVPPKVEYSLTEIGKGIIPVIDELRKWGLGFKITIE